MKWPKEAEIIKLLKTGKWGIGRSTGFNSSYWMQKGGLGRGGEVIQIHAATFWSMVKKELLINISKSNFGRQEFKLNEKAQKDLLVHAHD